jgi:exonuclease III
MNSNTQSDSNTVGWETLALLYHQYICHPDEEIIKEIVELYDSTDLMDLTDIYRVLHPTTAQYTFFSAAHGTFSKIDHI